MGGVGLMGEEEKAELRECWRTSLGTPYTIRLTFSAGIAGLIFGYNTGVMSGSILSISDDFKEAHKNTLSEETILHSGITGAIVGAAVGGWINDKYGWRTSIFMTDLLYFIGAIVMAVSPTPFVMIVGRLVFGFGVRMASMTVPLYISEISPRKSRGAHVDSSVLLITGGQFLAYLLKLIFINVGESWRLMLGASTIPALVQFILMLSLPESPQWLYRKAAFALSLVTSGLNTTGSVIGMSIVDRYGRRSLMIVSMLGNIACLLMLAATFYVADVTSPGIDVDQTGFLGMNATCKAYIGSTEMMNWDCTRCLRVGCGFCANSDNKLSSGACMSRADNVKAACMASGHNWYNDGCPTRIGIIGIVFLILYVVAYSPGMGTVPWIINSEIYALRFRGIRGGIAAVAYWLSTLIVNDSFLLLTHAVGSSIAFLFISAVSTVGLVAIFFLVPETKGLHFEEIEKMLRNGYSNS